MRKQRDSLRMPGLSDILKPSFTGGNWMSILEFSGEFYCNPDFLVSEDAFCIIEIACSGLVHAAPWFVFNSPWLSSGRLNGADASSRTRSELG